MRAFIYVIDIAVIVRLSNIYVLLLYSRCQKQNNAQNEIYFVYIQIGFIDKRFAV